MPSLDFVLPHWLYWSGLLLFPLLPMYLLRKGRAKSEPQPTNRSASLFLAYLFLITGGMFGLHRFYLRSMVGLVFLPLVVLILYANTQSDAVRNDISRYTDDIEIAKSDVEYFGGRLEQADAQQNLDKAKQVIAEAIPKLQAVQDERASWQSTAKWSVIAIGLLLLLDMGLLPGLFRKCVASENLDQRADLNLEELVLKAAAHTENPTAQIHTRFTDIVDQVNEWAGVYICFWTTLAVFVYYYEVLARYIFNSPSNWAHEAMFLMFGMQYLISGAYAFKENALVSVDVIYASLSVKTRVRTDVVTSLFFFLFTVALLFTGWTFMMDAIDVNELTMNEWQIQYWPVKATIVVGSLLLVLQGLSKLTKDILYLKHAEN